MNSALFLPKEIKVGFVERNGTYTGKLAYVVYMDEKGKLRKEKSFEGWRDHNIPTEQFENEPLSGFVLNKKAGGYSSGWNHRQTYVRMYDPRGFEFEITVENLLYILDNTSSIIGKGLEGEFVYAWSGGDLVLLPVNAPEYEGLKRLNELRHKREYVKAKDLKVGATYLTNKNEELVYLGKFDEYSYGWREMSPRKSDKKQFFFATSVKKDEYDTHFVQRNAYQVVTYPAISQKLIDVIDEQEHPDMEGIWSDVEGNAKYSAINPESSILEPIEKERFLKHFETKHYADVCDKEGFEYRVHLWREKPSFEKLYESMGNENKYKNVLYEDLTLEKIFGILTPQRKYWYLENGRHYKTEGLT